MFGWGGCGGIGEVDAEGLESQMAQAQLVAAAAFGDPLPGLTQDQLALFDDGKTTFQEEETPADGLGPVFNDIACAGCHLGPAVGGTNGRLETRFGRLNDDGTFNPLAELGGSLIQVSGIGPEPPDCNYVGEVVPPEATIQTGRRTTPLFGFGLVDAVPEARLRAVAAVEAEAFPEQAGQVSEVTNPDTGQPAVGKFGWKAQVPTLHAFSGDAYLNEMGITNPSFPNESCPQGDCALLRCNPRPDLNDDGADVNKFTDFMTFLGAPPRGPGAGSLRAIAGAIVFVQIGCANCHLPVLRTGSSSIAALDHKLFAPFSDFLLHDMGSLGDGITQNQATGRLMRTAPLWGVRAETSLLHDGRASTIPDAILAHDGQGARARDNFARLGDGARADLLTFLGSL
ncbi:MAG TPA: di-heme oxidoredictase family protein [Polyangia bacterium]|nr:di-heme oxidoredictase family protein [Polyangia bacterium]